MNGKLIKYQLIGVLTTVAVIGAGTYFFSEREEQRKLEKNNICNSIREEYKTSFINNCIGLNSPSGKDKLKEIKDEGIDKFIKNDCDSKCEEWWCAKIMPQNIYEPKIYSDCKN